VLTFVLLLSDICSLAQRCEGNVNKGCTNPGAACSPVTVGTGSAGSCQSPHQPTGEKECECVGQPYPPQPRTYAFDILSQGNDANGFLLNPVWVSQVDTVTGPPSLANPPFAYANCSFDPWTKECTTWNPQKIDQDFTTRVVCGLGAQSYRGSFGRGQYHYNWTDATYEGPIWYDEFSDDDDDINLKIHRWDNAGQTSWNEDALLLEFDANETVAHFPTTWWKAFWSAAKKERSVRDDDASSNEKQNAKDAVANMFIKHDKSSIEAIVTGALGLDCIHNCGSEIHPVFALALHVNDNPNDDTWAIFARNFGDEGYCSNGFLYRPKYNNLVLTLPWRVHPNGVTVYENAELISSEGAAWAPSNKPTNVSSQVKPLEGIVLAVMSEVPVVTSPLNVNEFTGQYWVEFELHYKWTGAMPIGAIPAQQRGRILDSQIRSTTKPPSPNIESETEPEKRNLGLTPADRKARRSILEEVTAVTTHPILVKVVPPGATTVKEVHTKLESTQVTNVESRIVPDPAKDEKRKRAQAILIKAHPELAH
jgi:hypothetical protein